MGNCKELVILIAEDDDGHADLIKEALVESGVNNPIIRFSDGQEAWNFLACARCEKVRDKPVRDKNKSYLLLLDITPMP